MAIWLCFQAENLCLAGWISEVQPSARTVSNATLTNTSELPPLIELSGMASGNESQLVIIDAADSNTRHGRILQTVTLTAGVATRLITTDPWPDDIWPFSSDIPGMFAAPDAGDALNLTDARGLLLFDRITGLSAGIGKIQDYPHLIGDAVLLDTVAITATGSGRPYQGEAVLEVLPGEVASRPSGDGAGPGGNPFYLTGTPDNLGFFVGITPAYLLNPGQPNLQWQGHMPEPAVTIPVLLLAMALSGRTGRASRRPDACH